MGPLTAIAVATADMAPMLVAQEDGVPAWHVAWIRNKFGESI
jgi:hypothetical protein